MKKILGKFNETGTLLVEAMAMLGLIAMVTPVLYKKAAERTVELQDVNASSQLRALSSAVDSYIKDNFAKITKGETIDGIDYGSFDGADNGTVGPIPLSRFADYLPYGFLNDDGSARETKLFTDDYQVWIKLEADYTGAGDTRRARSQILTGFISAVPKNPQEIGQVRASRIASMVGSNGGYVTGNTAMGAQGIWSVPTNQFPNGNLTDNTFVISSLQPISSQGLANEDVLHRKDEPDNDQELNTMETDLFMGSSIGTTRNIRMVNQMIMSPDVNRMVGSNNEPSHNANEMANPLTGTNMNDLTKTLYISRGGGAYIEGTLNAMNSLFSVDNTGINFYGSGQAQDGTNADGTPNMVNRRNAEPTFKVNETSMVYGNPGAGNAKLTVNSSGSMSFGVSAVPADAAAGTAAVDGAESLYADKENFRAGDGTLTVNKNANGWATVIGKDAAGAATAHEGGRTTYTWNNGVPTEGAEKTGRYEVSINGSAFVKDTMLTGKLKSYNVDAATLRAGVDPANFNEAVDDIDFYTITKSGSFVVGKSNTPVIAVSNNDYNDDNGRQIQKGVVIHTTDGASADGIAAGIDIRSGDTGLLAVNADGTSGTYNDTTQDMSVRIGGENGVYITAFNAQGNLNSSPVSIQGDMFRAYGTDENGIPKPLASSAEYKTIMTNTHYFNIFSPFTDESSMTGNLYKYRRNGYDADGGYGKVHIADSNFIISSIDDVRPVVDIMPVAENGQPTSKFVGGMAFYDFDYNLAGTDANGRSNNKNNFDDAAFVVNKGTVEVRTTAATDANNDLEHGEKIFVVDNNKAIADANRGSVYVRKGSINLATYNGGQEKGGARARLTDTVIKNQYAGATDAEKYKAAVGYIAADRFISQFKVNDKSVLSGSVNGSANVKGAGFEPYEYFEVNPAYTSVMHDIKLTTRGGARLSDILPDFINKGIYVIDATYDPAKVGNRWVGGNAIPKPAEYGADGKIVAANDEWGTESASNEVSPYLGFIPAPKCPPGYAKAATLSASGWAMAQAGTPVLKNGTVDIMTHNNPMEYLDTIDAIQTGSTTASIDDIQPLTYQKNTWLKAMVRPYCGNFKDSGGGCGETFKGWGAIMGYIYPAAYYDEYANRRGLTAQQDEVYWNLFPVYYKELEGYATVYCYFDRADNAFDGNYVDKSYDQLKDFESSSANAGNVYHYEKNHTGNSQNDITNTDYISRLNDPNLKYKDPW